VVTVGLSINTNIDAFEAHRNLFNTSNALSSSMQKLSSGLRINTAADDAAGLSISEQMQSQISGADQASRNAQDGISLAQTADGSLQEVTSILHRIRDLAVQYNNGTYGATGKAAITAEVTQLQSELTSAIGNAQFNGIALLSGAAAGTPIATLQVGPGNADTMVINGVDANASIGTSVSNFSTIAAGATVDINAIDTAINSISANRSTYGAIENRLQYTVQNLGSYQQNMMDANSRIQDVDMASEMTNFTRLQILQQSGTAMLAQANQLSASVLNLLK
jgi:flagellin